MEYKASAEVDTINATTNISTTPKAEETTVRINDQMIGNDDTKRTTDVTAKLGDGDVTKIAINPMHPSVHPPNQGHEQKVAEREGENGRCIIYHSILCSNDENVASNLVILAVMNSSFSFFFSISFTGPNTRSIEVYYSHAVDTIIGFIYRMFIHDG